MTGDLEQDLRELLAARAAAVTPDATSGEQSIADRLRAGDEALADVVPLARPGRRRWLVAAAVAAVVVLVAGVVATRHGDDVHTGPAAGGDSSQWVVRALFVDKTEANDDCGKLPGVDEVTWSITSDLPPGQPAEGLHLRVTGRDNATAAGDCLEAHGGVNLAVEPYATPTPAPVSFEIAPVLAFAPCAPDANERDNPDLHGTCYELGERVGLSGLVESAVVEPVDDGACGVPDPPCDVSVMVTLKPAGLARLNDVAADCYARSATCPTGQLALIVDGPVRSAPTIQQPSFDAGQIQISGFESQDEAERIAAGLMSSAPTTTTISPTDPLTSRDGESAKDVAERVARLVFGDEYVTTGAEPQDTLTSLVTMETASGDELVATVTVDGTIGRQRVVRLASTGFSIQPQGNYLVTAPVGGSLTVSLLSATGAAPFGPDLTSDPEVVVDHQRIDPPTSHLDLAEHSWLLMELLGDDGRTYRYLSSAGD